MLGMLFDRRSTRPWRRVALLVLAVVAALLGPAGPASAAAPVTVSLAFNDGFASQYRNAAPLLQSHGMNGTFYVASNWIKSNDARYMRFYHLDELYRQGNEIGGMGKDHRSLTTTYDSDPAADQAYKRDQVCGDHEALTTWGYHPVSFAYPGSAENAAVQSLVRDCGFTTGRVAGDLSASGPAYAEPVPPANPMRLRALTTPTGPLTLEHLQNAVTQAGENEGGWLPIGFNEVCNTADASYDTCMSGNKPIDASVLGSFLDWLQSQESEGVTVSTVRQVMGSDQPPLPPRPFVVSLTFDDALRSQYGLLDIFARHDVNGTFYINSGPVDAREAGTMTWAELREFQAAGHDMGGHTTNHVNLLASDTSYEYKTRQVCDDRQRLLEEGLNAVSFSYPFGAMDATAQPIVRGCGYQSGRKAGTVTSDGPIYSETIPVTENPYAIRILGTNYNGPVTLEALQYAVNQAMRYGGSWLPTLFHQICYVGTPSYDTCMGGYRPVSDETIDTFLTWIGNQSDRNISVRTVADVMGGGDTAPVVAVTGPASAATVTTPRPELTGTATGTGAVSVRVYQGDYSVSTPVATVPASLSGGRWTARLTDDLPDGTYTVQADQAGGNATGTSLPVRFTVDATEEPTDTEAPQVAITEPTEGATVDSPTPRIAGTAGTASGDEEDLVLRFFEGTSADGEPVAEETVPVAAGGSWSATAPALGDGVYTVVATQSDAAGNLGSSAPVTFTVSTAPVDTTAPAVTVTSPEDGETVDTATPTVTGRAGTDEGDDTEVQVTVSPSSGNGDETQELTAAVRSDGTWSVPTRTLADGNHVIQATQSDAAGNLGSSAPVTFTVSTAPEDTAPTIDQVATDSLGQGARNARVTVRGSGFDASSAMSVSGPGVATKVASRTASVMRLRVSVSASAATGERDLVLTDGEGADVTCTGCLSIVPGPKITSVSPKTAPRGKQTRVTVVGSGFRVGQMAVSVTGGGIAVRAVRLRGAERLMVKLDVARKARVTARSLQLIDTTTHGRTVRKGAIKVVRR
jgi:peptidoglycan/xylan/chitin deacetylase (PgdA/CDA1 family)